MIVGMIPTYKEGLLARDAINSVLSICDSVLVFEGPIKGAPSEGIPTKFYDRKPPPKLVIKNGEWDSEVSKRNAMLEFTRRYKPPTWGLFLDADEVILWPEYIESYIEACDAQSPEGETNAACPLLRVEIDGSIQKLHRIIRLDLLERHILSMSQWKFFGSEMIVTFPAIPEERSPNQGEPHIFHRAFLRPPKRGDFRLYQKEIDDFTLLEKLERERLGITASDIQPGAIPVQKDGMFVPLTEEQNDKASSVPLENSIIAEIERASKDRKL